MLNKLQFLSKFLILILILLSVIIAKSLLWFIIVTIFMLILLLTSEKSVNECMKFIKCIIGWLLFLILLYIIIFRNFIGTLTFSYKLLTCFIFSYLILYDITFDKLRNLFYTILYPLRKRKDIKKYSYLFSIYIYYIIYYFDSGVHILEKNSSFKIRKYGLKKYFLPTLLYTEKKINELKYNYEFKYYKLCKYKIVKKDYKIIITFLIIFIVSFFKEVIL